LYKSYDISPRVVNKAMDTDFTDSMTFDSKMRIYEAVIDLLIISREKVSLSELYSKA
jgi:hypothetical protein